MSHAPVISSSLGQSARANGTGKAQPTDPLQIIIVQLKKLHGHLAELADASDKFAADAVELRRDVQRQHKNIEAFSGAVGVLTPTPSSELASSKATSDLRAALMRTAQIETSEHESLLRALKTQVASV